jgi:type IV secretory pathway component VirB8
MEWYYILMIVIVIPIVLFVPFLIWAAAVSGIYQVIRERLRYRATVRRRIARKMVKEPVIRKIT